MREDTIQALSPVLSFPSLSRRLARSGVLARGALLAGLALSFGCSDSGSSADMTPAQTGDMAQRSCCGYPGDTGNSKGVGRYCTSNTDPACRSSGLPANICSTAEGNPNRPTFFCTMACSGDTDTTTCGENAKCTKNSSGLYGCVPQACLTNLPPGCPL
jgi:hypothetical protein